MRQESTLPYGDVFYPLLISLHKALLYCYKVNKVGKKIVSEDDEVLAKIFSEFEKFYKPGINKHLLKGLSKNAQKKFNVYPRLSKLTIQAFYESQRVTANGNFKGLVLPSPLYILFNSLVIPNEPQTSAYALVLCRSMLFDFLGLHPHHPDLKNYNHLESFEEKDVLESVASFRNYINIQARWPDIRMKSTVTARVNFLTGHFLALKGYSYLWFSTEKDLIDFCQVKIEQEDQTKLKYRKPTYRFRLSDNYEELPDPGEIINSLFGIPLPFRGADTLLFGGLKKTSKGGSVINLSGKPGAGKTSICLSMSALLAPMNTKTIYISLEEEKEDLYTRLITLIPEYLKELSIYNRPNGIDRTNWFLPYKIEENVGFSELTEILNLLHKDLKLKAEGIDFTTTHALPALCPLLVVLDNINELASGYKDSSDGYKSVEDFISACRKLGAIVILISADELSEKFNIDYLVDVAINIKQIGTDSTLIKPIRIFQLNKTRHQISRQGAHVFHLSAPSGFRICPQIPSQMDKKENLKRLLSDKTRCIHALNFVKDKYNYYLQIFPNSQILIHGVGSSGKAGFALKLLLSPAIENHEEIKSSSVFIAGKETQYYNQLLSKKEFKSPEYQTKVLIVSFLYPEDYYQSLVNERIYSDIRKLYSGIKKPKIKILPFYPGYLAVEDFINKIVRHLDEAILEGEPYSGILLDGLHNVFLQFKNLQENDMVWPLLYGILSRYKLTVVTTFTNFSVNNHNDSATEFTNIRDDQKIMLKGQAPFLHSLVKASDFYLTLDEKHDINNASRYIISVKSSIDQKPPTEVLEWDRQKLFIVNKGTLETLEIKKTSK